MTIRAFISGCAGLALDVEELAFFEGYQPWGLILFKRNVESRAQVRALCEQFRQAVGRANAPVLIDQEGGRVQRMGPPEWRRYPRARVYEQLFQQEPESALATLELVSRLMAEDLAEAGINVDCVPVLDVPQPGSHEIIGDRAYGTDAETIAALAEAVCKGFLAGGVLPVMKHIPGHGRAMADSHHDLPVVDASLQELENTDFRPFGLLCDTCMAMTAHVVYTALDGEHPATLSKRVIEDVIRGKIGFDGLLMTDDLSMKALSGALGSRVERAQSAGCDMMLHCNGVLAEMRAVAEATVSLEGAAAERAGRALAAQRVPEAFDRERAISDLSRILQETP